MRPVPEQEEAESRPMSQQIHQLLVTPASLSRCFYNCFSVLSQVAMKFSAGSPVALTFLPSEHCVYSIARTEPGTAAQVAGPPSEQSL